MRKARLSVWLLASAIIFFTACSKDDSTPSTSGNFNPLTTASTWTYAHTETGTAAYNFTLTATNRDTTANGKTYKVLTNSVGANNYLGKVGSDNYRFASFPTLGINSFEELFLKEDKNVNDSWSNSVNVTISGFPVAANLTYTIKGKGESRTVNGKPFNNVTYVRLDLSVGLPVGGGDFYYQDGVGLIEDIIAVTPPVGLPVGSYNSHDQIVSYDIK
jgi:hypothetical protein